MLKNNSIKNNSIDYSNLDWFLIVLTMLCTIMGIISISSAVNTMAGGSKYIIIQSCAAIIGIIAMAIISAIDYEDLGELSKFIYGLNHRKQELDKIRTNWSPAIRICKNRFYNYIFYACLKIR